MQWRHKQKTISNLHITNLTVTNKNFMDPVVVYVPRCVQNGSESLGLKALEDFNVGIGGCPP
jgi:hypothetical protein